MRNDDRRYARADFTTSLRFRNIRNALATDGWLLTDELRIIRLTGPAPTAEPAPQRYPDARVALDTGVHEALSAAQTVRQLLGGDAMPSSSEYGAALTWQIKDTTASPRFEDSDGSNI
ncbi:hypothetical protein [Actinoplanes auranticolor]|uniref:Uncharacterized protein n=1 Tax=Actinoplanes auranticolor TaxID=47988 RepID=A0A919SLG7_9ACTN|nr:hypothetical protein [Actinoplanes auranticolor]GIM73714.1 hypothetical protein Aau02nite_57310 [Actinoplanes auranticolor]